MLNRITKGVYVLRHHSTRTVTFAALRKQFIRSILCFNLCWNYFAENNLLLIEKKGLLWFKRAFKIILLLGFSFVWYKYRILRRFFLIPLNLKRFIMKKNQANSKHAFGKSATVTVAPCHAPFRCRPFQKIRQRGNAWKGIWQVGSIVNVQVDLLSS